MTTGDADRMDTADDSRATTGRDALLSDSQMRARVIEQARALADEAAVKAGQVERLMVRLSELLERDDDQS